MVTDLSSDQQPGNSSTGTSQQSSAGSSGVAARSFAQLGREKIQGFEPGSSVTIEVIGARTLGQFVVQPVGEVDNIALAAALNESTSRTATEFARIDSAKAVSEPSASELKLVNKVESTKEEMSQMFFDSELANPVRIGDLNLPTGGKWISVKASATKYSPGTVVYLALTSDPIVISEAVVDRNGNAVIEGSFPVQIAGSGGHRLRVVGTRQFADVIVDANGEIKLSDLTIAEIGLFDMQTSATVRYVGPNPTGGRNLAVRVVPLRAKLPWWTLWICGWTAFLGLILKLGGKLRKIAELVVGTVVLLVSAFPSQFYGWTEIAYPVMYWGAGITVVGIALLWLAPPLRRKSKSQPTGQPFPTEPRSDH